MQTTLDDTGMTRRDSTRAFTDPPPIRDRRRTDTLSLPPTGTDPGRHRRFTGATQDVSGEAVRLAEGLVVRWPGDHQTEDS